MKVEEPKPEEFDKIVDYWKSTALEDFDTMESLFRSKSYQWSLFLGHIVLEKLLKACYVQKHKSHAPFTHNLLRLAELSELPLSDDYKDWLDEITSFNMNARYNDFKREFYKKCTSEFSSLWYERIREIKTWILRML